VLVLRNPDLLPRVSEFRELSKEADLDELAILPCLVYESRDQILDYLGNRHVVGVKEWKPLAKARYVKQIKDRAESLGEDATDRALAKRIGSNAPYVRRLLNSLEAFESVKLKQPRDEARFSVLQTALQYSKIADWVGIGVRTPEGQEQIVPDALQELADWTLEPADPQKPTSGPRVNTRSLALLNDVVSDEAALEAFRTGETIDRAYRRTGAVTQALLSAMAEAGEALGEAVGQANRLAEPPGDEHRAALSVIKDHTEKLSDALAAAEDLKVDDPPGSTG
jgi:hypothetical protein